MGWKRGFLRRGRFWPCLGNFAACFENFAAYLRGDCGAIFNHGLHGFARILEDGFLS